MQMDPPGGLFLGPCLDSLFKVFCIRVAEAQCFGQNFVAYGDRKGNYRGGPHMRSLISIDFPAPEMEPESAHVVSAVSVP